MEQNAIHGESNRGGREGAQVEDVKQGQAEQSMGKWREIGGRSRRSQPGRWPTVELMEGGTMVETWLMTPVETTDEDEVKGSGAQGTDQGGAGGKAEPDGAEGV